MYDRNYAIPAHSFYSRRHRTRRTVHFSRRRFRVATSCRSRLHDDVSRALHTARNYVHFGRPASDAAGCLLNITRWRAAVSKSRALVSLHTHHLLRSITHLSSLLYLAVANRLIVLEQRPLEMRIHFDGVRLLSLSSFEMRSFVSLSKCNHSLFIMPLCRSSTFHSASLHSHLALRSL